MKSNEAPGTSALLMTIQILGDQLDAQQRELTEMRRQLGEHTAAENLNTLLYEMNGEELLNAQYYEWMRQRSHPGTTQLAFKAGWTALWKALCTIAEARERQAQEEEG